jgi:uncharacterized membrane protein (UPF0127 family)
LAAIGVFLMPALPCILNQLQYVPVRLFTFLMMLGVFTVSMLSHAEPSLDEKPQAGLPLAEMRVGFRKYRLEVASTPTQTELGLMYRTVLPENSGMLFRFNETRPVAFWMKNTRIPLDMLFVQSGKIVNIAHQAQPCRQEPCPVYPSGLPVDMVIELPGGTAQKDQIKEGSRIHLTTISPSRNSLIQKKRRL